MTIATLRQVRATRKEDSRTLCVSVLFTDVPCTLKALSKAATLAAGLNASIEVLAPMVVPYPLPMDQAPVDQNHIARHLRTIAGGMTVPTAINVIYCRDREEAVRSLLKPDAPVVVAWRKRWLSDRMSRLVRELRRDGYHVITVEETKGA